MTTDSAVMNVTNATVTAASDARFLSCYATDPGTQRKRRDNIHRLLPGLFALLYISMKM